MDTKLFQKVMAWDEGEGERRINGYFIRKVPRSGYLILRDKEPRDTEIFDHYTGVASFPSASGDKGRVLENLVDEIYNLRDREVECRDVIEDYQEEIREAKAGLSNTQLELVETIDGIQVLTNKWEKLSK